MTHKPPDPDVTDPDLKGAADLLRGLRSDPPRQALGLADEVVEQVRPMAVRRRRVLMVAALAAVLAAAAYLVTLLTAVQE